MKVIIHSKQLRSNSHLFFLISVLQIPLFIALNETLVLSSSFPFIFKKTLQHVHLNSWHYNHYCQVDHGPEVYPVIIAFLYISITSFKCFEQVLNLNTFAKPSLHTVDRFLVKKHKQPLVLKPNIFKEKNRTKTNLKITPSVDTVRSCSIPPFRRPLFLASMFWSRNLLFT